MTKIAQNWVALSREWGNGTIHVYDGDSLPHSLLRASQKVGQGPNFFLNIDPFLFFQKKHPKLQRFIFAGASRDCLPQKSNEAKPKQLRL